DALPERATVADRDDRIALFVRLGRHARADARERSDRAAPAERDATLAEDHRLRERDHAAVAERMERARPPMSGPDRAQPRDTLPGRMDRVPRDALDVLPQHRERIRRWPPTRRFRSASVSSTTSRNRETSSRGRSGWASKRSAGASTVTSNSWSASRAGSRR